jgi:hypothetical protein
MKLIGPQNPNMWVHCDQKKTTLVTRGQAPEGWETTTRPGAHYDASARGA